MNKIEDLILPIENKFLVIDFAIYLEKKSEITGDFYWDALIQFEPKKWKAYDSEGVVYPTTN